MINLGRVWQRSHPASAPFSSFRLPALFGSAPSTAPAPNLLEEGGSKMWRKQGGGKLGKSGGLNLGDGGLDLGELGNSELDGGGLDLGELSMETHWR